MVNLMETELYQSSRCSAIELAREVSDLIELAREQRQLREAVVITVLLSSMFDCVMKTSATDEDRWTINLKVVLPTGRRSWSLWRDTLLIVARITVDDRPGILCSEDARLFSIMMCASLQSISRKDGTCCKYHGVRVCTFYHSSSCTVC